MKGRAVNCCALLHLQSQVKRAPLQALPVQPAEEDPGSDADSEDEFLAQVCCRARQTGHPLSLIYPIDAACSLPDIVRYAFHMY